MSLLDEDCCRRSRSWRWKNGEVEDECLEGMYLYVELSKGILDLSLYRMRKIRGCSDGYGNYSHNNQGIVQMI